MEKEQIKSYNDPSVNKMSSPDISSNGHGNPVWRSIKENPLAEFVLLLDHSVGFDFDSNSQLGGDDTDKLVATQWLKESSQKVRHILVFSIYSFTL